METHPISLKITFTEDEVINFVPNPEQLIWSDSVIYPPRIERGI